ncbi:hypothetical protein DP030_25455, partial [Escherichia coli O106]|nr:hypothetical protein [Escherichia coli O106]
MKIKHWLVSFLISFSQISFADTVLDEVSKSVISVCHAPSSKGQKWDVQVLASGDVKVGLKFASKVAADAKVALTKSEWDGVQQVLREGANKQVISSQADSLIKISRIWADFFP